MENNTERERVFKFYSETLSFLHKSFDDYFYILDFTTGIIKFFGNIADNYNLPLDKDNCCTVTDWCNIMYPHDLERFKQDIRQLRNGEVITHNLEYRLRNKRGEVVWISCTGKIISDDQATFSLLMGKISDSNWSSKVDALTGALLFESLKTE
ncbi:MAG: PAS domain-containing protein, partial [Spirochaetaceae bacterium]|nr:PAS domain-containing protein [Spirochaetaceae bacterium]